MLLHPEAKCEPQFYEHLGHDENKTSLLTFTFWDIATYHACRLQGNLDHNLVKEWVK